MFAMKKKALLGTVVLLCSASAFGANIIVDEGFDIPGVGVPSDWTEVLNNQNATYATSGGNMTLTNNAYNCTSPPQCFGITVLANNSTFDPTVGGQTITMTSNIVSYTDDDIGANNIAGLGTPANRIGWGISTDGNLYVASAYESGGVGSGTPQLFGNVTLAPVPNYDGGPLGVTMTLDDTGFILTTNTGYNSGVVPYTSLGSGFSLANLPISTPGIIGLIGSNSNIVFDGFQLFTASGLDEFNVGGSSASIEASDVVVNTDVNVTAGGVLTQNGGDQTILDTMLIESGSTFVMNGGALDAVNIVVDPGGQFIINGGEASADFVTGDVVVNGGIWSPGNSPGLSNIDGDYDQASAGELLIELAGLDAGSEFDQVNVTGTATLGGLLDVDLLYGFTPEEGDSFDILTALSFAGTFDSLSLPSLVGLGWQLQYLVDEIGSTDVVRLTAIASVPVPAAVWLFGSALGLLGVARRRLTANAS